MEANLECVPLAMIDRPSRPPSTLLKNYCNVFLPVKLTMYCTITIKLIVNCMHLWFFSNLQLILWLWLLQAEK